MNCDNKSTKFTKIPSRGLALYKYSKSRDQTKGSRWRAEVRLDGINLNLSDPLTTHRVNEVNMDNAQGQSQVKQNIFIIPQLLDSKTNCPNCSVRISPESQERSKIAIA